MEEHYYELSNPEPDTLVVILDASESAEQDWPTIVDLAKKIFQKTPAGIEKKLFFLSNPQEYNIDTFEENVGSWRKKNLKKGSFISPILAQIKEGKIIVIGSGEIYDLPDWKKDRLAQNIVFVKIGKSMRGSVEIGKEIEPNAFDGQLLNLHNRILSVKINGSDFMPYYWDNPGYSINDENGISLIASNLENYSIKIAAYGENITASIEKVERSEKVTLPHIGISPPDIIYILEHSETKWENLADDEIETFREHKESKKILCPDPSCRWEITGSLKCDNPKHGKLLGFQIYKSLKGHKGFIVFKDTDEGVFFKQYPSEMIKIGEEVVARSKKFKAVILRYEHGINKWAEQEDLKPYHKVREGYYVSLL